MPVCVPFMSDKYRLQELFTWREKYDLDMVSDLTLVVKMGALTFLKKWSVSLNAFPWCLITYINQIAWYPRTAKKWKCLNSIRKTQLQSFFGLSSNFLWLVVQNVPLHLIVTFTKVTETGEDNFFFPCQGQWLTQASRQSSQTKYLFMFSKIFIKWMV